MTTPVTITSATMRVGSLSLCGTKNAIEPPNTIGAAIKTAPHQARAVGERDHVEGSPDIGSSFQMAIAAVRIRIGVGNPNAGHASKGPLSSKVLSHALGRSRMIGGLASSQIVSTTLRTPAIHAGLQADNSIPCPPSHLNRGFYPRKQRAFPK